MHMHSTALNPRVGRIAAHRSGECLRRSGVPPDGNRAGLLRFQMRVQLNGDVVAEGV